MSPFDFYFSDPSVSLDQSDFKPPIILNNEGIFRRFHFTKESSELFFEADTDFPLGSYYKQDGHRLLAISPFGAYRFDISEYLEFTSVESNRDEPLDLNCFFKTNSLMSWPVCVKKEWSDASGGMKKAKNNVWMRATKNLDDSWTPPHCVDQMRVSGKGARFFCTVLLPSPALKIEPLQEGVQIGTKDHTFVISDPLCSKVVLEGTVRWGYPNESGVFQLGRLPRLF